MSHYKQFLHVLDEFAHSLDRAKTTTSVEELKELATCGFVIHTEAMCNPNATEEVFLTAYAAEKLYNLRKNHDINIAIQPPSGVAQELCSHPTYGV